MTIQIKQLIAHDLDLEKTKPGFFDDIINLTSIPATVFDFFTKHITNSLNARQIKACTFNNKDTYIQTKVSNIAQNLTDIPVFIEETRDMAEDLFSKMKSTSTKSSGTLFFIIYNDTHHDYLAIMKMDPNNGIQIDKDTHTLTVQENMLPNPDDRLHKCAFVKLQKDIFIENVHLHVLDRQQTGGEVSKYFMINFLQASEILNDKIMTTRIIDKLTEEALNITPDPEKQLDFQFDVNRMFKSGRPIDIDHDLERLITPYIQEEKNRADFIEGFKLSLREDYEDVKFQFNAERDKGMFICFTSPGKEVKIEFDVNLQGDIIKVQQDKDIKKTVITIEGIPLEKKIR
ncbi:nucleoid-associated protein [Bacillus paranthracis]|uniref:nucleoid-associated protein n=1 Tax=Bacillus paranthracis TaxID=2026186 RepID=UPI00240D1146|nr:nucleoid-associated protein [Bacillus paranthracis]MDG1601915.1 nucleoid-associated protein [Bacillus paranthracis]